MLYNKCLTSKVTSRLLRFSECTQILEFLSSASFMERGDSLAEMAWLNDLGMKCMTPAVKIPLFTSHTTLSYGGNKTFKCLWLETISHLSSHHDLATFFVIGNIPGSRSSSCSTTSSRLCWSTFLLSLFSSFPQSQVGNYCFSFNNRLTMVSSGEKITLGISTMLNMTIFLMTVRVRHQTSYQDKFHLYFRIIYIFLPLGVGGKADPRFKVIVTPGDVWFAADRQNSNRQHLFLHHYGRARFLLSTTTKHS